MFQHELTALFVRRTGEGQYSWPSQPPIGKRDLTHVAVWEVAIATVYNKMAIAVNDISKDTLLEPPRPSSGSVYVRILTREDLNLHPVNKQDKTLQQSGLMRQVRESDRDSCRLAPARKHVNAIRYHSDSISCSRRGLNCAKPVEGIYPFILPIFLFKYVFIPLSRGTTKQHMLVI